MLRLRHRVPVLVIAAIAMLSGACSGGDEREVLVFAAASLTEAFADLEQAYEELNPDVGITLNLGGSSSLREQILEGAPAGVFASADETTMTPVLQAGLVVGDPEIFARNRLEIVVPTGNPGAVTGPADLTDEALFVGLCAEAVPCGRLADQMFANVGVQPAVDTREPDVRALLGKVASGDLDAGVVYLTDVEATDGVEGIAIPDADNVESRYPIAQLVADEDAASFVAFVLSGEGRRILASHGFGLP